MRNRFVTKTLSLLLLAGLLTSCKTGSADGSVTTTANSEKQDKGEKVEVVLNRTPTPLLAPEDIPIQVPEPDRWNRDEEQQQEPRPDPQEQGTGAQLDGYTQLLYYIDRTTLEAPAGWDRHPIGDLFDGIFETTDLGSNKYGQNDGPCVIEWTMIKPVTLSAYTVYTANDADNNPGRNPDDWTLYGSEDGENWVEIHSVKDAGLPTTNYTPTVYETENTAAYRYYRFTVEEVVGGGFQLSELLLYTADDISETPLPDDGVGDYEGELPVQDATVEAHAGEPIVGEDAALFLADHNSFADLVNVDSAYISGSCWADDEGPDRLFDGIYTEEDFYRADGGKMGAGMSSGQIIWEMKEAVAPTAYALVTGNDTDIYPTRNPQSWVLYGSNDGKNWVTLDAVSEGNMISDNFAPHIYTFENSESYKWFCLSFVTFDGSIQLCEIILEN